MYHDGLSLAKPVPRAEHTDVGREAGSGGDKKHVIAGGNVFQGKHADDLLPQKDPIAFESLRTASTSYRLWSMSLLLSVRLM